MPRNPRPDQIGMGGRMLSESLAGSPRNTQNAELKAISERFLGWPHRYADFRTLCILIIDRNRFHPEMPIQNPGGVLRALTQRHGAGQLTLVGSLIGLSERDRN